MKVINFKINSVLSLFIGIAFSILSCKKDSTTNPSGTTTTTTTTTSNSGNDTVPAVYKKIYGASSITSDGTYLTIKSNGLPDHQSCYWPTSNSLYQAFSGTTFGGVKFVSNNNTIVSQTLTFKIPLNPVVASSHSSTPMGPIGIAVNGVPFYNQYAAMYAALTTESQTLDQNWGHAQFTGQYHYHVEPLYLTYTKLTRSSLLGFLLDGFPVYGPEENGKVLTSSDLDAYHGHTSVTADYPKGIYHYHFTQDLPYLNGNGFYGTEGSISQ